MLISNQKVTNCAITAAMEKVNNINEVIEKVHVNLQLLLKGMDPLRMIKARKFKGKQDLVSRNTKAGIETQLNKNSQVDCEVTLEAKNIQESMIVQLNQLQQKYAEMTTVHIQQKEQLSNSMKENR